MIQLGLPPVAQPVEEFARDPALTVAAVLLMVVSVAWIVVARMIWINLRKAAARAERMAQQRRRRRRKAPAPARRR
jgi:cytochrome c-type biogenesis protein CcmH/NrfF